MKLYIESKADRDQAVMILARNGYTVRQGRELKGKKYVYFVEFWKGGSHDGNPGTDQPD